MRTYKVIQRNPDNTPTMYQRDDGVSFGATEQNREYRKMIAERDAVPPQATVEA